MIAGPAEEPSSPPPRRLTPSNALTSLRLATAPFAFCAIVTDAWLIACLLFWAAVASDIVDGRIARARGESSSFGGLLDHSSDAFFVALGLLALAVEGRLTWLLPLLVVASFVQYVFDSKALAGRPLRTSSLGRWNGIFYFVPLGLVVTRESLVLDWPGDGWVRGIAWGLVATTMLSMGDRARSLWDRARETSGDHRDG